MSTNENEVEKAAEQEAVIQVKKDQLKTKKPIKKPAHKKAPVKKAVKKTEEGYGVGYIAKALGKQNNLIRILLRKNKIKKPGKSYIWSSKSEIDSVVKKLKAA